MLAGISRSSDLDRMRRFSAGSQDMSRSVADKIWLRWIEHQGQYNCGLKTPDSLWMLRPQPRARALDRLGDLIQVGTGKLDARRRNPAVHLLGRAGAPDCPRDPPPRASPRD